MTRTASGNLGLVVNHAGSSDELPELRASGVIARLSDGPGGLSGPTLKFLEANHRN